VWEEVARPGKKGGIYPLPCEKFTAASSKRSSNRIDPEVGGRRHHQESAEGIGRSGLKKKKESFQPQEERHPRMNGGKTHQKRKWEGSGLDKGLLEPGEERRDNEKGCLL